MNYTGPGNCLICDDFSLRPWHESRNLNATEQNGGIGLVEMLHCATATMSLKVDMMVQTPKYAQLESERRFLITECPDLSTMSFRLIEDLYVSESRLRLRAITHIDGQQQEFKFCKKYPSDDVCSGAIVNIYLTADEHRMLSQLTGKRIRKRRYRLELTATTFSLDVFEDQLAGLVLCEVDGASAASLELIVAPTWAQYEVTDDPFFTGGNLANICASALRAKLSSIAKF